MKIVMSIREAWYGLILIVAFLPFVILLVWGGIAFHDILLDRSLQYESARQELLHNSFEQEISRLTTMLENKSDPMAYTMMHTKDESLLLQLLNKVLGREPAIHLLVLLRPDSQIILGIENKNSVKTVITGESHHLSDVITSPSEITVPMQGKIYIGSTFDRPDGVFFTISVPVGSPEKPHAILLAEIDANIIWNSIHDNLQRDEMTSYIVNANGAIMVAPVSGTLQKKDDASKLPIVNAFINNRPWPAQKDYRGIQGRQVFGISESIESLGWNIVTEIEKESILLPIRKQTINVITTATLLMIFFLALGMLLVNRVVRAIKLISNDFERIGKQDFKPSTITSPFSELGNMVNGFNRMVKEIARKQQGLNQAQIVFDNTSEGVIITDAQARIVSVNNAFTKITGYCEDEVIGKNPSMLQSNSHDKDFYKKMWHSINSNGCWRGEVLNRRKNGECYTELLSINSFKDEHGAVIQYVGVITDISSIKDTEHKLKHLAHHDPLTGLPNRLLCNARMEHELQLAKRQNHMVAVMFIDLDMFKTINDSLGHILGDVLLREVTDRISQYIRDEDTIARLGGDEFVLILGSINNKDDATHFAQNLLSLFSNSFDINGHEIFISASVGIALYPDHGNNVDSLLRNADAAMYRAKAEGRNNFQYYTVDLTNDAFERMSQETYLRHALKNNELILHYQPQYSLKTGKMIAVEALIRWQHPELGLVYPDKFISVAEETGLIVPIGEWIIETACRQLNIWGKSAHPSLRMAINLSARQFWKPGLTHVIKDALDSNNLNANRLDLEMTESIIMRDTDITIDTLNYLHSMGVELSIDDFGTGYSSLSYLKRFPINRLKIDRSFVSDITTDKNDADMIQSIIALGHCMNLCVLAEGVETKDQLNFLTQHGCDEVQGYYYSRPLPAEELELLFSNASIALCN